MFQRLLAAILNQPPTNTYFWNEAADGYKKRRYTQTRIFSPLRTSDSFRGESAPFSSYKKLSDTALSQQFPVRLMLLPTAVIYILNQSVSGLLPPLMRYKNCVKSVDSRTSSSLKIRAYVVEFRQYSLAKYAAAFLIGILVCVSGLVSS